MQKLKESIEKLKTNDYCIKAYKILWIVLCAWLFMKMILNLGYVSESVFQTHKDYYFGVAVSFFLLAVLLLQRIKLKNIFVYVFIAIYWFIAYRWLETNEMNWGEELQNVYKMRWICGGILGVSLIDIIRYKKIAVLKDRNLVMSVLFVITALMACIISSGRYYSYVLLMPFVLLYLMRVLKKDWNRWIFAFSLGYYSAFIYTMIKSFQTVPYTGARYYGIYINHGLFGIFIGGAFVCALWWLLMTIKCKKPLWQKIVSIVAIIFSIICIMMNGARVAEMAVIASVVVVLCIWGGKSEKKQIAYRIAYTSLAIMIVVAVGIALLAILKNYDKESLELLIENDMLRQKVLYWCGRAQTAFDADSIYGTFKPGSIMNAIDRFSSSRLSYAMAYLRELNWFGHEYMYVEVQGKPFTHPHNTYVYWLYGYGILSGAVLILWNIYYIWTSAKNAIKNQDVFILPFLWVVYFSVVSLNEDILWIYVTAFILLIMQYPLLVKMNEEEPAEQKDEEDA